MSGRAAKGAGGRTAVNPNAPLAASAARTAVASSASALAGEGVAGSPAGNPVLAARQALLEGVGAEVAASFPGITRLGGQIVAALYLADRPGSAGRSMDELSAELGRSKSNIFANLRALEASGIVERRREAGARHDRFALRGDYPDVIIGAYVNRLRHVVVDKRALVERSLGLLGTAKGDEADVLRQKLSDLGRKYALFGDVFERLGPALDGPIDLEPLLRDIPPHWLDTIGDLARGGTNGGKEGG